MSNHSFYKKSHDESSHPHTVNKTTSATGTVVYEVVERATGKVLGMFVGGHKEGSEAKVWLTTTHRRTFPTYGQAVEAIIRDARR